MENRRRQQQLHRQQQQQQPEQRRRHQQGQQRRRQQQKQQQQQRPPATTTTPAPTPPASEDDYYEEYDDDYFSEYEDQLERQINDLEASIKLKEKQIKSTQSATPQQQQPQQPHQAAVDQLLLQDPYMQQHQRLQGDYQRQYQQNQFTFSPHEQTKTTALRRDATTTPGTFWSLKESVKKRVTFSPSRIWQLLRLRRRSKRCHVSSATSGKKCVLVLRQ